MVTLKDIASRANVSASTVSRILSDRSSSVPISESTREKVVEIARALGFRPNEAARRLQMRPQWTTLALLYPRTWGMTAETPFSGNFLRAILDALGSEHGLAYSEYTIGKLGQGYRNAYDVVSGMVIVSPAKEDLEFLADLRPADRQRLVVVNRTSSAVISVDGDNFGGSSLAVSHLLERGHRRIGLITDAVLSPASNVPFREQAFERTLSDYGMAFDSKLVYRVASRGHYPRNVETLRQAVEKLLAIKDPPTALFCVRDNFAYAVINELKRIGLRVPDQMAVVGFDGAEIGDYSDPPITSARLPAEEMGRIATEIVVNNLSGGALQEENVVLPCELVVRGST